MYRVFPQHLGKGHSLFQISLAQCEILQYETLPVKRKFNLSSHTCIVKGLCEVIVYWAKENCNYDKEIWVMTWHLLLQRWWEQREVDKILFYDSQWKFQCTEKYDCEKPKLRCQRSKKTGRVFYCFTFGGLFSLVLPHSYDFILSYHK